MINQILTYLWNTKQANTWIFLELIFVAFFMWSVIDPVFVIFSNKAIDKGYDTENVYMLNFKEFSSMDSKYNQSQNNDSLRKVNFQRIYQTIQHHPDIETFTITLYDSYPYSESTNSGYMKNDTLQVMSITQRFYTGTDYFGVFRINNVESGNIMLTSPEDFTNKAVYITDDIQKSLHLDLRDQETEIDVFGTTYKVAGVTSNFKLRSTEQPVPAVFIPLAEMYFDDLPYSVQICFRTKDGINQQEFMETFRQEVMPRLEVGNFYPIRLTDFDSIRINSEYTGGITNTINLQVGLAIFFLLCTFLGISGTFWLRSNERRRDIGTRMALGASREIILKEFFTEAWLLTTMAWVIGVFFALQRVYFSGFAFPPDYNNPAFLHNNVIFHFSVVSIIVYLLMIVIAAIGTWIPAYRAASILPANALHSE